MIDPEFLELGAVILTGLDSAIMGRSHLGTIVYSYDKVLHCFEERGMTREESIEFVDFNVLPLTGQGAGFVLCYESDFTGGIDTSRNLVDFIDTKKN